MITVGIVVVAYVVASLLVGCRWRGSVTPVGYWPAVFVVGAFSMLLVLIVVVVKR